MNTIPNELIPAPKMTVKQVYEFVAKIQAHPQIRKFDTIYPRTPMPGDMIVWTFAEWGVKYETLVIEKFDWDAFNEERIAWEKEIETHA